MHWVVVIFLLCQFRVFANKTELILTSIIFRHGARTTYNFYPNDPNINNTFYPVGLGGLTNEGKMGEFKLGHYMRKHYGHLLGDVYTEDKIRVTSTDITRTKMSAQLVLAGLFPPGLSQMWNDQLLWQPIPVSYTAAQDDELFHPREGVCPYKDHLMEKLPQIQEVQEKYVEPYRELYAYLEEKTGKEMKSPLDIQEIFFILKCEKDMNLTVPQWADDIYPEPIEDAASVVYSFSNYNMQLKRINSGYLLRKILNDSKEKINGNNKVLMYLYSGHETTIGYMLDALNVTKPHIPSYGSALAFEIHRNQEQSFIKIRYRDHPEALDPIDLPMPGCDGLCPFEQFVELVQDLIPPVDMETACRISDKSDKDMNFI